MIQSIVHIALVVKDYDILMVKKSKNLNLSN